MFAGGTDDVHELLRLEKQGLMEIRAQSFSSQTHNYPHTHKHHVQENIEEYDDEDDEDDEFFDAEEDHSSLKLFSNYGSSQTPTAPVITKKQSKKRISISLPKVPISFFEASEASNTDASTSLSTAAYSRDDAPNYTATTTSSTATDLNKNINNIKFKPFHPLELHHFRRHFLQQLASKDSVGNGRFRLDKSRIKSPHASSLHDNRKKTFDTLQEKRYKNFTESWLLFLHSFSIAIDMVKPNSDLTSKFKSFTISTRSPSIPNSSLPFDSKLSYGPALFAICAQAKTQRQLPPEFQDVLRRLNRAVSVTVENILDDDVWRGKIKWVVSLCTFF